MKISQKYSLLCVCMIVLMSACTPSASNNSANLDDSNIAIVPSVAPMPTAEPTVNLTVCLASIPETVDEALNNQFLRNALFSDSPNFFSENTGIVLTDFPSPKNNSLYQKLVTVNVGDRVVNDAGQIVELTYGTQVKPADCSSSDCTTQFDGEPIEMAQLVANFAFNNQHHWEDGTPVSATDSIFAFQWALENSPGRSTDETHSYMLNENGIVEWIGIPGLFTQQILDYFWAPLPQHHWGGKSMSEISLDDLLSFGPFLLKSWNSEEILLGKNYQGQLTGTKINQITLREISFDGENLQTILSTGGCDIVENDIADNVPIDNLLNGEESGDYLLVSGNGYSWVSLYFGIVPSSYDDVYNMWGGDRADYFGNIEMRQYVSQCLQKDFGQTLFGEHGVSYSGLYPDNHPNKITQENLESSIINLDDSPLLNTWPINADGVRYSQFTPNIFDGTLFELSLFFPDTSTMHQTAQLISSQLSDCGITTHLSSGEMEELFKTGAEGLVFGRNFDLALIPWQTSLYSVCELMSADAVPGEDLKVHPFGWGGWNATGWKSEEYDIACDQVNNSFVEADQFDVSNQLMQTKLASEVPIIPLFVEPSFWAANTNICGLQSDQLTSKIINIHEIDILLDDNQACP
jgi:peptide/nickel transport system substrate-binding protein